MPNQTQSEILSDFKRRYENTYVFVVPPNSSEESIFFIDKITEDREKVAKLELNSPDFGKIRLNYGTSYTFKFKYPPIGVFQHDQDAYIFMRCPQKQYKHGLCQGNGVVYPVYRQLITGPHTEMSFEVVISSFEHRCYTFKDAYLMLQSGKYRSVALRNNFSMLLSVSIKKQFLLLHWDTPIAVVGIEPESIVVLETAYENIITQIQGQ